MSAADITRSAIRAAFLELQKEKNPEKITVKDISEKCGINRNTFYYHYQDTFTLLEEIFQLDFDQIVEQYPKLNSLEECLDAITLNAKKRNTRSCMYIGQTGKTSTWTYYGKCVNMLQRNT